ncbi:MAG: PIG-L family deacetylase [Clostridia bacterium]|nr:PIG-L family deacetylase [Clostridia bacterium]
MKLNNNNAVLFIPDGAEERAALERTTHMAISAHQDDIELMAYYPISTCFGKKDEWFCGVVTTDGAGSPRNGLYADYTDEDMKEIRIVEQKKAAYVGEYGSQFLLGYPSKQAKDPDDEAIIEEYVRILRAAQPKYLYTHNLADKHDTHLGVAAKVVAAVRRLNRSERPEKFYGCEVWRDLDWMPDEEKVYFDVSGHPNIAMSLVGVFDSQILGGKRYDLAAEGRRIANATYSASHACDVSTGMSYAMDLTPLAEDDTLSVEAYVTGYIRRFMDSVSEKIRHFYKK